MSTTIFNTVVSLQQSNLVTTSINTLFSSLHRLGTHVKNWVFACGPSLLRFSWFSIRIDLDDNFGGGRGFHKFLSFLNQQNPFYSHSGICQQLFSALLQKNNAKNPPLERVSSLGKGKSTTDQWKQSKTPPTALPAAIFLVLFLDSWRLRLPQKYCWFVQYYLGFQHQIL